ncbi:hypothetical protein ACA910_008403 [Epithemia clementina (nom. ined.)]
MIFHHQVIHAPEPYIPKTQKITKRFWAHYTLYLLLYLAGNTLEHTVGALQVPRYYKHTTEQSKRKRRKRLQYRRYLQVYTTTSPQSKDHHQPLAFDTDSARLMIDDGASASITNTFSDFITPPRKIRATVTGIGGTAKATHKGTVRWLIDDDTGVTHAFTIQDSYFVPSAPTRILSPQQYAQQRQDHKPRRDGTGSMTLSNHVVLFWNQRKSIKTIPLDRRLNIGITTTSSGIKAYNAYAASQGDSSDSVHIFDSQVVSDEESDEEASLQPPDPVARPTQQERDRAAPAELLSTTKLDFSMEPTVIPEDPEPATMTPHDELLRWHYRLGHMSFERLRHMVKLGLLPKRLLQSNLPLCSACQYGKMHRKPWKTKGRSEGTGVRIATRPRQIVSVDQLESTTAGFIAQLKGGITKQRYKYATIFVDHHSRVSFVFLQRTLTSADTVAAKKAWERWAAERDVRILHYHADNGRFADNGFIQHCADHNQSISYCGVNAHFQNGIAEKRIRDLQEATRTALVYALHKWPRMISIHLWPYAMRTANEVHNSTPTIKGQQSPLEIFGQVEILPKLRHFHPFGCPIYVLDNALQAHKGVDKWKARARLGFYLGPSPNHSRSVHLVLNPRTAHVSPQFHVRHDDFFETVTGKTTDFDSPKPQWKYLSGLCVLKQSTQERLKEGVAIVRPVRADTITGVPNVITHQSVGETDPQVTQLPQDQIGPGTTVPGVAESEATTQEAPPTDGVRQTSSGRKIRNTQRYEEGMLQRQQGLVAWEVLMDQDESEKEPTSQQQFDLQLAMDEPISFAASADPDTMYYHEAMQEPDRELFREAMQKEIFDHESNGHWEIIPKALVPLGTRIIDMIWSMKRKRRIDTREVYKRKARLNVNGGQQEYGLNYWETYAPVVNWQTLRLFFTLSILKGWSNRQMDFVLAYPHAPAEVPLYMNFPQGYRFPLGVSNETHKLKLKQNIYGQKQAGRIWNKYLEAGLDEIGFSPSKIDPCLYFRGRVILLVYIDDCILFSPNQGDLDTVIKEMKEGGSRKFRVEDLGEVNDFLGVKVRRLPKGVIELTQPHLIDTILKDLHFQDNTSERSTPALSTVLLHKDAHGKPWQQDFHYRRVVGKLNFLEKSTRPDIAYAVHQCARFCDNPKKSHADAVRRIGKYLKSTRDKGLIFKPEKEKSFECWVDADFCSGYRPGENNALDPMSSKSRSGWVLTYASCPITWSSKMQSLTALSSTESEYIALSSALRDMIPLMELAKEIHAKGIDMQGPVPAVHCSVWEDNSGALEMAKVHKVRPRTKHLNNQYHHFRGYVDRREIELFAKATDEQIADMLTKPLPEGLLCKHRRSLMGW